MPQELLPTRLVSPSERPPAVATVMGSTRFRGLVVSRHLLIMLWHNLMFRFDGYASDSKRPALVKARLQQVGMLWIKLVQTVALRTATFSPAMIEHLLDVRDRGLAGPFEPIRAILEAELGRPIDQVFEVFEETPFVATTVSQIHRAKLKHEEVWVAVKVQHPNAYQTFMRDLAVIRRAIKLLNFLGIFRNMRWDDLYYELEEGVVRELNYQYELSALKILRRNLTSRPMHVPEVFGSYCGKRVLVMEYIRAALLSDYIALSKEDPQRLKAWLKVNNIDPKLVAERLFNVVYRQTFEDNYFHGDMNAQNIILLRDSKLAIIDCRSTGSMEMEILKKQAMFLGSLGEGELTTAGEIYFLLASRLPKIDLNKVKQELVRIWRSWEMRTHITTLPFEQKSMTSMMSRVNQLTFRHKFGVQWAFSRLNAAWVHLDQGLTHLDPEFNYREALGNYFRAAERRRNVRKLVQTPLRVAGALSSIHKLYKRMDEYTLFQETIMRRQAQVAQGSSTKVEMFVSAVLSIGAFASMLMLLLYALVLRLEFGTYDLEPFLGPQLTIIFSRLPLADAGFSGFMLCFLSGMVIVFTSMSRKFSSREYNASGSSALMDV